MLNISLSTENGRSFHSPQLVKPKTVNILASKDEASLYTLCKTLSLEKQNKKA